MLKTIAAAGLIAALLSVTTTPEASAARTAPRPVFGAIGDSITYGTGSTMPDGTTCGGIATVCPLSYPADAGIPSEGRPGQALVISGYWAPLTQTFPTDLGALVAADHVTTVVVEIGINDLGHGVTDQQYEDAYQQLVAEGLAQRVHVVFSTITPFGAERDVVTPDMQAQRVRVNTWIRTQPGHVEFAKAIGGDVLNPAYDSGDGLHPDDAGYAKMAGVLERYIARHQNGLPIGLPGRG